MSSYVKVLTSRNFGLVYWSHFFAALADKLIALMIVGIGIWLGTVDQTDGNILTQVVFLTPFLVFGPLLGVWVDRLPKKKIMLAATISRGILALVYPLLIFNASEIPEPGCSILMYAALFLIGCMTSIFSPAKSAIVPEVLEKKHHTIAYALIATVGPIATIMATPLAGFILGDIEKGAAQTAQTLPGALTIIWISLAVYAATSSAVYMVNSTNPPTKNNKRKLGYIGELRQGFKYIIRRPALGYFIINHFVFWAFAAFFFSYTGNFCERLRPGDMTSFGIIFGLLGVGMITGNLAAGKLAHFFNEYLKYPAVLLITSLLLMVFSFESDFETGCLWVLLLGITGGFFLAPVERDINRHTHESYRGRVFTVSNLCLGSFVIFMMVYFLLRKIFDESDRIIFRVFSVAMLFYAAYAFKWSGRLLNSSFKMIFLFLIARIFWLTLRSWYFFRYGLNVDGSKNIPLEKNFILAVYREKGKYLRFAPISCWPFVYLVVSSPENIPLLLRNRSVTIDKLSELKKPSSCDRSLCFALDDQEQGVNSSDAEKLIRKRKGSIYPVSIRRQDNSIKVSIGEAFGEEKNNVDEIRNTLKQFHNQHVEEN